MPDTEHTWASCYSAFISYSHRDADFARRLQRALESYSLPRRLAVDLATLRPGTRRLRPVFRDRDELPAAADLTGAVRAALIESNYLIVVCSPSAAASDWVGREVQLFRDIHGSQRIVAALYAGTPETAFPGAIMPAASGGRSPLAADFRPTGDGNRLALLKLVAVLAGVRLDDLVQRDAHRRVQRITAIAMASVLGMVVAALLAAAAIRARATAERERARGEKTIEFMLTDLRQRLKGVGSLKLLNAVNQGALQYYKGQNLADLPATQLEQRAKLLQDIGEDDETRGDLDDAAAQFNEAMRTTTALYNQNPNDPARVFAHGQSEFWIGEMCERHGDSAWAEYHFRVYAWLARRLLRMDPHNPQWLMETGYAQSNLGEFLLWHAADTVQAGPLFQEAQKDFLAVAQGKPIDHDLQIQIADGYAWLADVERVRRNYPRAAAYRDQQQSLLASLLAADPRDFEARGYMVGNYLGRARIAAAMHRLKDAIDLLQQAHKAAQALAREDADNASMAQQVRVLELFQARTWLAMTPAEGRPPAAIIAATIGDCTAGPEKPDHAELAAFCTILRARSLAAAGDTQASAHMRASIKPPPPGANRLTQRWLLDMDAEAKER